MVANGTNITVQEYTRIVGTAPGTNILGEKIHIAVLLDSCFFLTRDPMDIVILKCDVSQQYLMYLCRFYLKVVASKLLLSIQMLSLPCDSVL